MHASYANLSSQAGFRTKRFFILRDRTLSYHKHEPRSQAEARSDYAMHSIQLKHYFSVERSSSWGLPCVKVSTIAMHSTTQHCTQHC